VVGKLCNGEARQLDDEAKAKVVVEEIELE